MSTTRCARPSGDGARDGGVMARNGDAGKGREGAEGVDVDYAQDRRPVSWELVKRARSGAGTAASGADSRRLGLVDVPPQSSLGHVVALFHSLTAGLTRRTEITTSAASGRLAVVLLVTFMILPAHAQPGPT